MFNFIGAFFRVITNPLLITDDGLSFVRDSMNNGIKISKVEQRTSYLKSLQEAERSVTADNPKATVETQLSEIKALEARLGLSQE